VFGLLVQGADLPHLERSQKCPIIAERLHGNWVLKRVICDDIFSEAFSQRFPIGF